MCKDNYFICNFDQLKIKYCRGVQKNNHTKGSFRLAPAFYKK